MRPTRRLLAARPVAVLADASVATFRAQAFAPSQPALFPPTSLALPAQALFPAQPPHLDAAALAPFAAAPVATERAWAGGFARADAPLGLFVAWAAAALAQPAAPAARLVVAQSPLAALPPDLRALLPAPPVVAAAGRGDVYGASLWLGVAPTATPLHRDPNPNLLVQLAGAKVVRMLEPAAGRAVWEAAAARAGGGAEGSEAMMKGRLRDELEDAVWGESACDVWEARIEAGDGVFIPTGWWHAVRGVGRGLTGSVNWWFR